MMTREVGVALVAVEVSGEVLVEAGVEGEEDLEVGEVEVEVETLISGQETGLARTQGKRGINHLSNLSQLLVLL